MSKREKNNKYLEGSWNVTVNAGEIPPKGEIIMLTFSKKGKKEGTGVVSSSNSSFPFEYVLIYINTKVLIYSPIYINETFYTSTTINE